MDQKIIFPTGQRFEKMLSRFLCGLLYILGPFILQAQEPSPESLVAQNPIAIGHYRPDTASADWLLVKVPYAKAAIQDTSFLAALRQADVVAVHLLFTDYPANQSLRSLNRQRFEQLFRVLPQLAKSRAEFLIFRQMDGNTKAAADTMLHGFAIQFRKRTSETERKDEIELISTIDRPAPNAPAEPEPDVNISQFDYIHYNRRGLTPLGPVIDGRPLRFVTANPDYAEKRKNRGDSLVRFSLERAFRQGYITGEQARLMKGKDSVTLVLGRFPDKKKTNTAPLPPLRRLTDSSLVNVMRRNRFNSAVLMADVTGSMAPYNAQVMHWIQQVGTDKLRWFGCFNDGNGRADASKEAGRTGGIAIARFEGLEEARELMVKVMKAGNGGDLEENVVEALQQAEFACPGCAETILIADAWAPARDIGLVKNLTHPVRVIVCGRRQAVHPDYITIATLTKGSLHFPDRDYDNLSETFSKGELIIEGQAYSWKNGQAVRK